MQVRSPSPSAKSDPRQFSIFDFDLAANDQSAAATASEPPPIGASARKSVSARTPANKSIAAAPIRVVSIADLPPYAKEHIDQIEASMAALPPERLWFTYQDIGRSFGLSRATVARRLKDGLVPGVRFQEGRMLEDGAVRRLDRNQLRWLLLAVRRDRDCARQGQ